MSTKHLSPEVLNQRRMEAVRLRLDGLTVAETASRSGLSAPTVSAAWKAFRQGGWAGVPVRPRGRQKGDAHRLRDQEARLLWQRLSDWPANGDPGWTSRALAEALTVETGHTVSPRAIDHWLTSKDLKPLPFSLRPTARHSRQARWLRQQVKPLLEKTRALGGDNWLGGVRAISSTGDSHTRCYQLYVHGKRGVLYTHCLTQPPKANDYIMLFERLSKQGPASLVFHGAYFKASADIADWLGRHSDFYLLDVPPDSHLAAVAETH